VRRATVIFCASAIFALSACDAGERGRESVVFAHFKTGGQAVLTRLIERFEKETGIAVEEAMRS
jgi:ABC-type glycerol-3-phosphate transport system substrate-binding protein